MLVRLPRHVACGHTPAAPSVVLVSSRVPGRLQPCTASSSDSCSTSGRHEIAIPACLQRSGVRSTAERFFRSTTVPSTSLSWATTDTALTAGCTVALAVSLSLLLPGLAEASGGSFSGQSLEMFQHFLEEVESLGPWGAVLFVIVVMLFEMVPLFPTQPLSLASGLLFGTGKGALLMLTGVTLAALNAFLLARGVGRPLAQRVIDAEMSHSSGSDSEGEGVPTGHRGNAVASKLADVQAAIEGGGLVQQLTAITLLRLTPVVPFSASNYLLGLTPVLLPAYLGGTLLGMSVWACIYSSLGGASRALLENGADISVLLADLASKASAMSSSVAQVSLGVAGAGAAMFGVSALIRRGSGDSATGRGGRDGGRQGPGNHPTNGSASASPSASSTSASASPARATVGGRLVGSGRGASSLNNDGAADSQDLPRSSSSGSSNTGSSDGSSSSGRASGASRDFRSSIASADMSGDDEPHMMRLDVQQGGGQRGRGAPQKVRASASNN